MVDEKATKKQHELLQYIDSFIKSHDYAPSYREIMRALDYKSVSTVAVHVNGLITKGILVKKDNSARSIRLVSAAKQPPEHIAWLRSEIEKRRFDKGDKNEVEALEKALDILTN